MCVHPDAIFTRFILTYFFPNPLGKVPFNSREVYPNNAHKDGPVFSLPSYGASQIKGDEAHTFFCRIPPPFVPVIHRDAP